MTPASPLPRRLAILLGLLALGCLLAIGGPAVAEEEEEDAPPEIPKLTTHPVADAKAGEYLRYRVAEAGWKKWFVERVIDTREGEVLTEVFSTTEEGKDQTMVQAPRWRKIPAFKAASYQRVIKDEMLILEVNGEKVRCRYIFLEEPLERGSFSQEKIAREVWYSNDVPCWGKVKEKTKGGANVRIATSWGTMSESDLKKRQEAYRKSQEQRDRE